jgi:hypothetical protein
MQTPVENRTNEDSKVVEQVPAPDKGGFECGCVGDPAWGEVPCGDDRIDARFLLTPP